MYKIIDLQLHGREFAEGALYKNKKEIVEALASYHDIDFTGADKDDNELSIQEYFKYYKITTIEKQLKWILEYGEWEIKKVKNV